MNTDDLIRALAADDRTVKERWSAGARICAASLISLGIVVALVACTLGVRSDLADAVRTSGGIAKFALSSALAVAACLALSRAAEPGRPARLDVIGLAVGIALAVGALWAIAAPNAALAGSPLACFASILGFSMLPFAALIMALRKGATTNLEAAGAVAGLAAGGIAAFGFGLSCPMDFGAHVALWYPLAIACAGGIGLLSGRRVLAW